MTKADLILALTESDLPDDTPILQYDAEDGVWVSPEVLSNRVQRFKHNGEAYHPTEETDPQSTVLVSYIAII